MITLPWQLSAASLLFKLPDGFTVQSQEESENTYSPMLTASPSDQSEKNFQERIWIANFLKDGKPISKIVSEHIAQLKKFCLDTVVFNRVKKIQDNYSTPIVYFRCKNTKLGLDGLVMFKLMFNNEEVFYFQRLKIIGQGPGNLTHVIDRWLKYFQSISFFFTFSHHLSYNHRT